MIFHVLVRIHERFAREFTNVHPDVFLRWKDSVDVDVGMRPAHRHGMLCLLEVAR